MTRGTWHVTDVSNACRTLLFDLETGDWSDELCALFGVPARRAARAGAQLGRDRDHRPDGRSSASTLPIAGHRRRPAVGAVRADLLRRGRLQVHLRHRARSSSPTPAPTLVRSDAGLLSTAAWRSPDGELTYALEGAIFVTGAAVQWLRDGLQIVGSAAETEAIAATVDDTEGVVFVPGADRARRPALGPARPRHDPRHHPRHDARAHRPRDAGGDRLRGARRARHDAVGTALDRRCASTAAPRPTTCSASSRPTSSACPSSGRRSSRPPRLGAAFLAGLGTGVWSSTDDLRETWQLDRRFEPAGDRGRRRRRARPLAGRRRALQGLGRLVPREVSPGWPDIADRSTFGWLD